MNLGAKNYFKDCRPELLLKYWFNCWSFKDPQEYQDIGWDWEEEIKEFIKDPVSKTIEAIKSNPETCYCCGKFKDPRQLKHLTKGAN